jgi:hypothetical protein
LTIEQSDELAITDWQKEKVRERIKSARKEDFINWEEVKLQFNL